MKKNMLYIFVAPYPATYCRATIWCVDITSGCRNKHQAACDTLSNVFYVWMW